MSELFIQTLKCLMLYKLGRTSLFMTDYRDVLAVGRRSLVVNKGYRTEIFHAWSLTIAPT